MSSNTSPPLKHGQLDPEEIQNYLSKLPRKNLENAVTALMLGGDASEALSALDPILLAKTDIWIKIFSFLGPGHYVFVALVCHQFKELYMKYFSKLEVIPRATMIPHINGPERLLKARTTVTSTYYRAAFSSVSCAEFWDKDTKEDPFWEQGVQEGRVRLLNEGRWFQSDVCGTIALHGNLEVLKWARQLDFPWGGTVFAAAKVGHLEILQYALQNGGNFGTSNELHLQVASLNGQLRVLQWFRENNVWNSIVDDCICQQAAFRGHLDIVKWAHENNFEWDEATCTDAAEGGHVHVLEYARKHGCPWNVQKIASVVLEEGHYEILNWALENGFPPEALPDEWEAWLEWNNNPLEEDPEDDILYEPSDSEEDNMSYELSDDDDSSFD